MIATLPTNYKRQLLFKEYELKDPLGDVMLTFSDLKLSPLISDTFRLDLLSVNNYYPFGMLEPERQWKSNLSYRFGYNGMEKDDEVKGSGNSLDFGERFSDPRQGGRFWKIDPLAKDYPFLSPYVYSADNPILFVDRSGEDYALYINHETHTIIVKATYVALNEESREGIQRAVNFWNSESDKFQYLIVEGEEKISYSIKFELTISSKEEAENSWFLEDKGPINTVQFLPEKKFYEYTKGKSVDGSYGYNWIRAIGVNSDEDGRNPNIKNHEFGHNLGIRHQGSYGTMSKDANGRSVWEGYINDILGQAGIGKNKDLLGGNEEGNSKYMGLPVGPSDIDKSSAESGKIFQSGTAPEKFLEGEVKEK